MKNSLEQLSIDLNKESVNLKIDQLRLCIPKKREKKIMKNEESLREMWDTISYTQYIPNRNIRRK